MPCTNSTELAIYLLLEWTPSYMRKDYKQMQMVPSEEFKRAKYYLNEELPASGKFKSTYMRIYKLVEQARLATALTGDDKRNIGDSDLYTIPAIVLSFYFLTALNSKVTKVDRRNARWYPIAKKYLDKSKSPKKHEREEFLIEMTRANKILEELSDGIIRFLHDALEEEW